MSEAVKAQQLAAAPQSLAPVGQQLVAVCDTREPPEARGWAAGSGPARAARDSCGSPGQGRRRALLQGAVSEAGMEPQIQTARPPLAQVGQQVEAVYDTAELHEVPA